jgi:hypothetical protein
MAKNILVKRIEEILDLTGAIALHEANKKLINTVMFLNGELKYIIEFHWDHNKVSFLDYNAMVEGGNHSIGIVKSLEIFMPETGIYSSSELGYIYINKVPKKQWSKSFSEAGYILYTLAKKATKLNSYIQWRNILNLTSFKKVDIIVDKEKNIFYHNHFIGVIGEDRVICKNELFTQEIKDWLRDTYGK